MGISTWSLDTRLAGKVAPSSKRTSAHENSRYGEGLGGEPPTLGFESPLPCLTSEKHRVQSLPLTLSIW